LADKGPGYCRWSDIETRDGLPVYPLRGKQECNDSRNFEGHVFRHETGSWLFAGCSFTLEHALRINGFDERMDGTKSLEDCDFGMRLAATGGKFVMDRDCYVHILEHDNACQSVPWPGGKVVEKQGHRRIDNIIAVENYGTLRANQELREYVANKYLMTDERLKIIQRETLRYRGFDPLTTGEPMNSVDARAMLHQEMKTEVWLGTPTFDLTKEREKLRKSPLWNPAWNDGLWS